LLDASWTCCTKIESVISTSPKRTRQSDNGSLVTVLVDSSGLCWVSGTDGQKQPVPPPRHQRASYIFSAIDWTHIKPTLLILPCYDDVVTLCYTAGLITHLPE
jgi:hypothetical protein